MNATRMSAHLVFVAVAACASGEPGEPQAGVVSAPAEGVVLGRIAESNIPKGECGMILWTLDERQPAPIFRYISGKAGEIAVNGVPVVLTRADMSGQDAFGVFERQTFAATDGSLAVAVDVRFGVSFDGGSYLERGVVTIESASGWRTVAPSAGLAGCRAA